MTEHQTNGDARETVEERGPRAKGPSRAELIQKLDELQAQLEQTQAQSDEHMRAWQRAAADYSNYKRRTDEERGSVAVFANALLIGKLLAVLDDFDRALDNVPPDTDDSWVEGVRLVERKLRNVLESEGVTPIEAIGQPFDPNIHEAVVTEEDPSVPAHTVIAVLQKGYFLHDRLLRPALVKVAVGGPEPGN